MSTDAKRIAELEAQVAALQASKRKLSCKVSTKGAVSLYGLGRFPVTLYKSQWENLLEEIPMIKSFLEANDAKLKMKG